MSYSALSRDALDPATPPHTRRNAESPPPRSPRSPRSLLRSERRGRRPNLDEWTPAEYYTPDCLHPSEAGFRHLFRELARTLEAG